MKRYRIINVTFDSRPRALPAAIPAHLDAGIQAQDWAARLNTLAWISHTFGEDRFEQKITDCVALGPEPFSVVAFHNQFFKEVRGAFILGCYYPALVAACALGERILNHLIRELRDHFKDTPEYKTVYRKKSFDDWDRAIGVLDAWGILLPGVAVTYRQLKDARHAAIHFRPETDKDARELAVTAISLLSSIIGEQFGGLVPKPWYMADSPAETFVRKDAEEEPFVASVILRSPCAVLVGPQHELESASGGGFRVVRDGEVGPQDGTDEDFLALRRSPWER